MADETNGSPGAVQSVGNFVPPSIAPQLPPGTTCNKTIVVRVLVFPNGQEGFHIEYPLGDEFNTIAMLASAMRGPLDNLAKRMPKQEESPAIQIPSPEQANELLKRRLKGQ